MLIVVVQSASLQSLCLPPPPTPHPPQLYEILARTPYGSLKRGEVGIDRLLSEQVFAAAYPLHEVST